MNSVGRDRMQQALPEAVYIEAAWLYEIDQLEAFVKKMEDRNAGITA